MRSIRRVTAVIGLGVALMLSTTAGGVARSPLPSSAPAAGRLAHAFWFLPPSGTDVAFTDWDRIRTSLGAEDLTGASPLEAKMDALLATNQAEAMTAGFGLARIRGHRDAWGFDTFDLAWEANYSVDGSPVFVLRFRDGFDPAPLVARFDERGFSTTQVDGAVIRSHDMDMTSDWLRATEFAILNTAFLDDGRTLVLSSGLDSVQQVLATRGMPRPLLPGLTPVLDALDGASAARLAVGPGTCLAFTPPPFDIGDPDASLRPLRTGEPLHPYTVLGVGYARPGWDPVGRIAMGFFDADAAAADAPARIELARTGTSLRAGAPYGEAVFTLEDSAVVDGAIVLDVAPVDDMPRRLFQMIDARDMSFAGC